MTHTIHEYSTQIIESGKLKVTEAAEDAWDGAKGLHIKRNAADKLKDRADKKKSPEDRAAERLAIVKRSHQDRIDARRMMDEQVPVVVGSVLTAAEALGDLSKYDVCRTTASGQRVLFYRKRIKAAVKRFDKKEFESLDRAVQVLSNASDPDVAIKTKVSTMQRYEETIRERRLKVFDVLRELEQHVIEYGKAARDMFNEEIVKAWVKEHPDLQAKLTLQANELVDQALDKGAPAAGHFKPVVDAIAGLKTVFVNRQIEASVAHSQVKREEKKYAKGRGLDILRENPAYAARRIAQKQKRDVKQILDGCGAIVKQTQCPPDVWKVLSGALQTAADAYFDRPWQELEEKLGTSAKKEALDEKLQESVQKEAESLLKKVPGKAKELVTGGGFEKILQGAAEGFPEYAKNKAVSKAADFVIKKLVKKMPISEAQQVDVGSLLEDIDKIGGAVKRDQLDGEKVESQRPTETADGRKVLSYLMNDLITDDDGQFYYVVIEDPEKGALQGKMRYHKSDQAKRTFKAMSSSDKSKLFPDKDKNGTTIDAILAHYTDGRFKVRAGDLIGWLNTEKEFTPSEPAGYADWSGRVVGLTEYTDESGVEQKGKWVRVDDDKFYFETANGSREWARGSQVDKGRYAVEERLVNASLTKTSIAVVKPTRVSSSAYSSA